MKNSEDNFSEFLEQMFRQGRNGTQRRLRDELESEDIYLYGAGSFGKLILEKLAGCDLHPVAFLDQRGNNGGTFYHGYPVFRADDPLISEEKRGNAVVLIAFCSDWPEIERVRGWLLELGYARVEYVSTVPFVSWKPNTYDRLAVKSAQMIRQTFDVLADEKSRRIFRRQIEALYHADAALLNRDRDLPQYFPDDIPFSMDYSRFIDCGAFTGDTAADLLKYKGPSDALACFEPSPSNFRALCDTLRRIRAAKNQIAFPCAVSDANQVLSFCTGTEENDMGAAIVSDGSEQIQAVRIDDALMDFAPTFIKMDIEGAEGAALRGAERTIRKWKPALAVCVYHRPEDMWELPMLVKELVPDYRLYLRSHNPFGIDTVLYAVHGQRT